MPTEVVHTIAASGGDYTNLYDWQVAQARDLVSADEIAVAEVDGDITSNVTLASASWTTDATRHIIIRPVTGQKALGRITGSGFAKVSASRNAAPVIITQVPYTHVEDVYIENTSTTGGSALTIDSGANGSRVVGCSLVNQVTSTNSALNALNINNVTDVQIQKCVGYLPAGANPVFRHNSGSSLTTYFLNCAAEGGSYGYEIRNGSVTEANWTTVINCAAKGHSVAGIRYEWTDRIPSGTRNNASEDTDAADIAGSNSVTAISSADFNAGDYLGVASGKLAGAGYDHGQFTTDINGTTISSWPIGLGIVADPDPLASLDGDLVPGQTRTVTASYFDSPPTHVELTDSQSNTLTIALTSIGSDQYTFPVPSLPSTGSDVAGLMFDGESHIGTITVRVYNSSPEEYEITEVGLIPPAGQSVATLAVGFDDYLFQEWPDGEPAAVWQILYPTANNTSINELAELQTDATEAFTLWIIDLEGTWYGITLDPAVSQEEEPQLPQPSEGNTMSARNSALSQSIGFRAMKTNLKVIQESLGELRGIGRHTIDDDFLGPTLNSAVWTAVSGADGSDPAISAGVAGGVVRLTSGGGASGIPANNSQLCSGLNFKAENGGLLIKARLKIDNIANATIHVGFTDSIANEMPFALDASNDLTSTATNAVCLVRDAAGTGNWYACGVKADTDAGPVNTGVAPVNATYQVLEVYVAKNGNAEFFIDDALVARVANAVTPSALLTPVISCSDDNTAARNLDLDRVIVQMEAAA